MDLLHLYFILLFGHWIGDFVLQTHWQATNKSKNNVALLEHVAMYSFVMTVMFYVGVTALNFTVPVIGAALMIFCALTFVTHIVTDYFTSRLSSAYWQKDQFHSFFVVVGFDQLLHQYTIILTMLWLLG